MLTLYLTGPREGSAATPRATFLDAARRLRAAGFRVLSLSDLPEPGTSPAPDWQDWARAGIRLLLEAQGVARLRGTGHAATIETDLARQLGMPIKSVPGWLTEIRHTDYMERITS
jgi:hypothetical protein